MESLLHFSSLSPPLSPNNEEVEIYKKYASSHKSILLLGYTKELLDLATIAIDINPIENDKVVKGDWFDIEDKYDVIIGDGVLNLVGGTLADKFIEKKLCKTLIIRFFPEKLENMRYATYFKDELILNNHPTFIIPTNKSCIFVWDVRT